MKTEKLFTYFLLVVLIGFFMIGIDFIFKQIKENTPQEYFEPTLEDVTSEGNEPDSITIAVRDTESFVIHGTPTLEDITDIGCIMYDHSIIIGDCNTTGLIETSYVLIVHVDSINIEKRLTKEEFDLISQILIAVNKVNK